jgi:hypothetical protein
MSSPIKIAFEAKEIKFSFPGDSAIFSGRKLYIDNYSLAFSILIARNIFIWFASLLLPEALWSWKT